MGKPSFDIGRVRETQARVKSGGNAGRFDKGTTAALLLLGDMSGAHDNLYDGDLAVTYEIMYGIQNTRDKEKRITVVDFSELIRFNPRIAELAEQLDVDLESVAAGVRVARDYRRDPKDRSGPKREYMALFGILGHSADELASPEPSRNPRVGFFVFGKTVYDAIPRWAGKWGFDFADPQCAAPIMISKTGEGKEGTKYEVGVGAGDWGARVDMSDPERFPERVWQEYQEEARPGGRFDPLVELLGSAKTLEEVCEALDVPVSSVAPPRRTATRGPAPAAASSTAAAPARAAAKASAAKASSKPATAAKKAGAKAGEKAADKPTATATQAGDNMTIRIPEPPADKLLPALGKLGFIEDPAGVDALVCSLPAADGDKRVRWLREKAGYDVVERVEPTPADDDLDLDVDPLAGLDDVDLVEEDAADPLDDLDDL